MNLQTKIKIWDILSAAGAKQIGKDQFFNNWPECNEFRFQGTLGFSAKIWAPKASFPAIATAHDNPNVDRAKLAEINAQLAILAPALSKSGRAATVAVREVRAAKVRREEREARRTPKT
jgi:hypothetical protein